MLPHLLRSLVKVSKVQVDDPSLPKLSSSVTEATSPPAAPSSISLNPIHAGVCHLVGATYASTYFLSELSPTPSYSNEMPLTITAPVEDPNSHRCFQFSLGCADCFIPSSFSPGACAVITVF